MSTKGLNSAQSNAVKQLSSFTGLPQAQAVALLQRHGWSIERAADAHFSGESAPQAVATPQRTTYNRNAVDAWFRRYMDSEGEVITDEGIELLCRDLGLDTQDLVVLIISWKMEAKDMCVYTREEWHRGMQKLDVDGVETLRAKVPQLRAEVAEPKGAAFRQLYSYCFDFAREGDRKNLGIEEALSLWQVVLDDKKLPLTPGFLQFMKELQTPVVPKDLWSQTLEFMLQIQPDLSNFDENDAWPVAIDEFVAQLRKQQAAGAIP